MVIINQTMAKLTQALAGQWSKYPLLTLTKNTSILKVEAVRCVTVIGTVHKRIFSSSASNIVKVDRASSLTIVCKWICYGIYKKTSVQTILLCWSAEVKLAHNELSSLISYKWQMQYAVKKDKKYILMYKNSAVTTARSQCSYYCYKGG